MGKRNLVLYTDDELIIAAKAQNINLSEEFTNYLKARLFSISSNSEKEHKEKVFQMKIEAEQRAIALERELESIDERENQKKIEEAEMEMKKRNDEQGWSNSN